MITSEGSLDFMSGSNSFGKVEFDGDFSVSVLMLGCLSDASFSSEIKKKQYQYIQFYILYINMYNKSINN